MALTRWNPFPTVGCYVSGQLSAEEPGESFERHTYTSHNSAAKQLMQSEFGSQQRSKGSLHRSDSVAESLAPLTSVVNM